MFSKDEILTNHELFKKMDDMIEKLKIAAKNSSIQFIAAKKEMEEVEIIANSMGFKIDKSDGSLNAL